MLGVMRRKDEVKTFFFLFKKVVLDLFFKGLLLLNYQHYLQQSAESMQSPSILHWHFS